MTYLVVAHPISEPFDTDICVDWAIEMLELGFETPSLLILASFSKPTHYFTEYFEIMNYLQKSINELGLSIKQKGEVVLSYTYYYVKQIALNINIRQNLETIYEKTIDIESNTTVSHFHLLYWAWRDFDDGLEHSYYWDNLESNENIERIVVNLAQKWVQENKIELSLNCKT